MLPRISRARGFCRGAAGRPACWSRVSVLPMSLCALALVSSPAVAQTDQLDVVYGRVYAASDSTPVIGAALNLRPLKGAGEMNTLSREQGVYAFFWMDGPHAYTLRVSARGFATKETRVVRNGTKPDMVVDFYLQRASTASLSPVKVLAASRAMSVRIGGAMSDRLGMERSGARTEQLTPEQQGNVNALVVAMPDVRVTTGLDGETSYSALGLAASQNNVMLNGSTFSGTALPRDAVGFARFARTPFDPSRGGFSGGQISVVLLPGSNNSVNTVRLTGNSSRLASLIGSSGDPTGAQSQLHVSGTASGAIVPDRFFYNTSAQARRRWSDVHSVFDDGLHLAGPGADSIRGATEVLSGLFPTMNLVRTRRVTEEGSVLGRFDLTPYATNALSITVAGQHASTSGALANASATPSHAGIASVSAASEQLKFSRILGGATNDLRLSLSQNRSRASPVLLMPEGRVLMGGSAVNGSPVLVEFGGNSRLPVDWSSYSLEATNEISWYTSGGSHQPKIWFRLRKNHSRQVDNTGRLGTYTYFSLDDLAHSLPSTFERNLESNIATAEVSGFDASVGDLWQLTPSLLVQYGARFESARYVARVHTVFREIGAPQSPWATAAVSPRLGFKWTYGSATLSTVDVAGQPKGEIHGGIGVFRNDITAERLAAGLSRASTNGKRLVCVGSAILPFGWNSDASLPASSEQQCEVEGNLGLFTALTPSRSFYSNSYQPETSARAVVGWALALRWGWNVGIELTESRALHQPGSIDLNLSSDEKFVLADEGGRPVYVLPEAITAAGVPSIQGSRVASQLGALTEFRSDLESRASQVTLTIGTPRSEVRRYSFDAGYTFSSARDQVRGFGAGGSTAASPQVVEWGRSLGETRHQLVFNGSWKFSERNEIGVMSRLRSGGYFTPLVSSDINGDGEANDRAFIFPMESGDSALDAGMTRLIGVASRSVRGCLGAQRGRVGGRASCEGPWTMSLDGHIAVTPQQWLGRRATLTLSIVGLPMIADRLLHGSAHRHGWGQADIPDPILLSVRGFDASATRYRYTVNPNFGKSLGRNLGLPQSAQLTFDARVLVGRMPPGMTGASPTRSRSATTAGTLTSEALALRRASLDRSVRNIIDQVLMLREQLHLDSAQSAALLALQLRYTTVSDSAWTGAERDAGGVTEMRAQGVERYLDGLLTTLGRVIQSVLTPAQYEQLPAILRLWLEDDVARRTMQLPD